MRIIVIVALCAVLAGCATASPEVQAVQVVRDPALVSRCQSLGDINAVSLYGGRLGTPIGEGQAAESLKEQAVQLDGTHVLITETSSPLNATRLKGVAYKCL
jgi:hypothetical protein